MIFCFPTHLLREGFRVSICLPGHISLLSSSLLSYAFDYGFNWYGHTFATSRTHIHIYLHPSSDIVLTLAFK